MPSLNWANQSNVKNEDFGPCPLDPCMSELVARVEIFLTMPSKEGSTIKRSCHGAHGMRITFTALLLLRRGGSTLRYVSIALGSPHGYGCSQCCGQYSTAVKLKVHIR